MDPEVAFYPAAPSIDVWLEGHPEDPTAYTTGADASPLRLSTLSEPTFKRKALDDISSNAMPEKRRRISPSKGGDTLSEEPQTPLQSRRTPYFIPPDDDNTPRASEDAANIREPRSTNYAFSAGRTSPSRSSTSSSARSRSPLKRMGDLQFMDRSINAVAFENTVYPLPPAAKQLLGNMRKIASGKQVVPECLKVRDMLDCALSVY
jgi:hypothetical protein